MEFGGSGEDSFVAVVVTKLTGALLFILLLTMVIMALLPKAMDENLNESQKQDQTATPLQIETPGTLPDAIAGRHYALALAATGGRPPLKWSASDPLPDWLTLDPDTGRLTGTPPSQTTKPAPITIAVSDSQTTTTRTTLLEVLPPAETASQLSSWKPRWSAIPVRLWLEQGLGFLLLWLVYLVAVSLIGNLERSSIERILVTPHSAYAHGDTSRRFVRYRWIIRGATLSATLTLALWLAFNR
jgi:hypothetical protein